MFTILKTVQQLTDKEKTMIHVYEEHIDVLEKENKSLNLQVEFLKQQLAYKTFGKPSHEEDQWKEQNLTSNYWKDLQKEQIRS